MNDIAFIILIILFFAFLGISGYAEVQRMKSYKKMVDQQREFYYWGTQWFYRREKEEEEKE